MDGTETLDRPPADGRLFLENKRRDRHPKNLGQLPDESAVGMLRTAIGCGESGGRTGAKTR